jgi:hypothetical protein
MGRFMGTRLRFGASSIPGCFAICVNSAARPMRYRRAGGSAAMLRHEPDHEKLAAARTSRVAQSFCSTRRLEAGDGKAPSRDRKRESQ